MAGDTGRSETRANVVSTDPTFVNASIYNAVQNVLSRARSGEAPRAQELLDVFIDERSRVLGADNYYNSPLAFGAELEQLGEAIGVLTAVIYAKK